MEKIRSAAGQCAPARWHGNAFLGRPHLLSSPIITHPPGRNNRQRTKYAIVQI